MQRLLATSDFYWAAVKEMCFSFKRFVSDMFCYSYQVLLFLSGTFLCPIQNCKQAAPLLFLRATACPESQKFISDLFSTMVYVVYNFLLSILFLSFLRLFLKNAIKSIKMQ